MCTWNFIVNAGWNNFRDSLAVVTILKLLKNNCKGKGHVKRIYLLSCKINFYHQHPVSELLGLPRKMKKLWLRNRRSHLHTKLLFAWRWLCINYIHLCSESLTVYHNEILSCVFIECLVKEDILLGWFQWWILELHSVYVWERVYNV